MVSLLLKSTLFFAMLFSQVSFSAEDTAGPKIDLPYNLIIVREPADKSGVKLLLLKVKLPSQEIEEVNEQDLLAQVEQNQDNAKVIKLQPIPLSVLEDFLGSDDKLDLNWRNNWHFFYTVGSLLGLFGRGYNNYYGYYNTPLYQPSYGIYYNNNMYRFNAYPYRYSYPGYYDSYYYWR